jgi:hypothetical protein
MRNVKARKPYLRQPLHKSVFEKSWACSKSGKIGPIPVKSSLNSPAIRIQRIGLDAPVVVIMPLTGT